MPAIQVVTFGSKLQGARAVAILSHGRGATTASMQSLADVLAFPRLAFLAPQAPGNTWYPYPLTAPVEQNEPRLSEALSELGSVLAQAEQAGVPAERVLLAGFSQGASLTLEYVARHPKRYGGVGGLSGGLIGAPGVPRSDSGSLAGTPVFLGCSDPDPFIPRQRVLETEAALDGLGAAVTTRFYPHMGHTVNQDEVDFLRELLETLLQ